MTRGVTLIVLFAAIVSLIGLVVLSRTQRASDCAHVWWGGVCITDFAELREFHFPINTRISPHG